MHSDQRRCSKLWSAVVAGCTLTGLQHVPPVDRLSADTQTHTAVLALMPGSNNRRSRQSCLSSLGAAVFVVDRRRRRRKRRLNAFSCTILFWWDLTAQYDQHYVYSFSTVPAELSSALLPPSTSLGSFSLSVFGLVSQSLSG